MIGLISDWFPHRFIKERSFCKAGQASPGTASIPRGSPSWDRTHPCVLKASSPTFSY